jgi:hypothetical protein
MVSNGYKWLSGWWFQPTPLKNDGVSWDYEIPNIWKKKYGVPISSGQIQIWQLSYIIPIYPTEAVRFKKKWMFLR